MDLSVLKYFFNSGVKLPTMFIPEPAMRVPDVPRFINDCIKDIENPNGLQRIKDIRLHWLLKLKDEIENPSPETNPENLYVIRTSMRLKDCLKVEFEEYAALRNKIKDKLLEFYETVTFNDAGMNHYNISFYCRIGNHGAIQSFNSEQWIDIDRKGIFEEAYAKRLKVIEYQSGWAKEKASHF